MKTKFIKSKRIISVVLAVCMVLSLGVSKQTKAATTTRKTLALNQTYTETWEDDETKVFQFTVPQAGNIDIEIKHTNPVEDKTISLSLYDSNNAVIFWDYRGSNVTLPTYSTDGNRTYYLKVKEITAWDASYYVTIHFQTTTDWESENNDTTATADAITVNQTYKGTITEKDSCDCYKLYIPGNRKVSVKFGPTQVDGENHEWNVYLLNSKNESARIVDCSGINQTYTTYLKKGTYYLKVEDAYGARNIPYSFGYTVKGLTIKQPKITSIKGSAYKGWFDPNYVKLTRIKIKNSGACQGYQVQVAKRKSMKGRLANEMVAFESGNSKGKVSLQTSMGVYKKYYVRARGYVTDPFGKKIYGKYSKVKCKKTKRSTYKKFKN